MRVAIYARYSDDKQNPRSIEDQVELCTRHARAKGWTIVNTFLDAAISGAAMANRPGLLAAVAAAEDGQIDALLTEDEDRIARSLEHLAHVVSRLDFAGARLATLEVERVETMRVAFKGLIGQDYLKGLSAKTKRGMHSNAEKGLATGSRLYGYASQPGGAMAIVETERTVILRIFQECAQGAHARQIAAGLNTDRIPGPRGGTWNTSTIAGSKQRANGVLNTELYAGVKVFNRIDMRKDPRTGKRISKPRPEGEWKRVAVPHLRIVPPDLWAAVRARRDGRAAFSRSPRPKHVFSGLIRCAECGASMTVTDSRGRLGCAAHREKGPAVCTNDRRVARQEVESRVLTALRDRLLTPAAVKAYVLAYHQAWEARRSASTSQIAPLARRVGELTRQIERLVDAICDGTASPAMRERLAAQEAEKADVVSRLAIAQANAPPPLTLHPRAAEQYARRVDDLQALLTRQAKLDTPEAMALMEAVRALVDHIDVRVVGYEKDAPVMVTLHGTLAAFMRRQDDTYPQQGLYRVVAGGGIEPPTCGL
ncbi:recombinase family protein [Phenylobacterium sp.]|uniref:recombinase family protein n=1 Tax=Phenylobacterium sp. TaxID=1871053 RepID=UPI003523841D